MSLLDVPVSENHKSVNSEFFVSGRTDRNFSNSRLSDCKLRFVFYAFFLINMLCAGVDQNAY